MFNFDELIGMTFEEVTEFADAQLWDTDWFMDHFFVSDRINHWVEILFDSNWMVCGWETA